MMPGRAGTVSLSPDITDRELVGACRAGNEDAWALLVDRFSRYVYAIATQAYRLADHDAEDVFQEVFARTYEHLGGSAPMRRSAPGSAS